MFKKCTILIGDVNSGRGCACVEEGSIWEISVPSQFCCEPNYSQKIKSLEKCGIHQKKLC